MKEFFTKIPITALKNIKRPTIPYVAGWFGFVNKLKKRVIPVLPNIYFPPSSVSENNLAFMIILLVLLILALMIMPTPSLQSTENATITANSKQSGRWLSSPKNRIIINTIQHTGSIISPPVSHLTDLLDSIILEGVTFKSNSNTLDTSSYQTLDAVAKKMQRMPPEKSFEIAGHTDNVGSTTANQILSSQRAESVMNYLISQGVKAERLTSVGYGDSKAIAENTSAAGRRANRRVELNMH